MTKSDRHSISPRLAGGEVCKERLRGGGKQLEGLLSPATKFFPSRLCIFQ